MAARKPLVINSGIIEQLQSGDTLDAASSEVDVVSKTNDNASAITIGKPVYVKSNGNVDLARANAIGTTKCLGLVRASSIAAAASGEIITNGVLVSTTGAWDALTGETGGLTPGAYYYVNSSTAGQLMQTAATSAGLFVAKVGLALSTTDMYVDIDPIVKL